MPINILPHYIPGLSWTVRTDQSTSCYTAIMSKRLRDCNSYLRLLLSRDRIQSEAILVTATDKQVKCLSEIIRNVLRLPVPKKTKKLIEQHRKILDTLADKDTTVGKRLDVIQKSHTGILDVLLSVKSQLLALL